MTRNTRKIKEINRPGIFIKILLLITKENSTNIRIQKGGHSANSSSESIPPSLTITFLHHWPK